ncbi:MAG: succinate dehydrogenase, cytochrome b556 subunit [Burkholderiales bacterium]|nr:succinate dehydrogenase, cytochrome b556 subunit [Burkholderiales bacterium]
MKNDFRSRNHPAYWAFIVHRLSGVLLALFLPLHFWALGQALQGAAALDGFLRWTEHPLVKFAETGLVLLLAAHMAGGLRLLALEFLEWREWQKTLLAAAAGISLVAALAFLLNLV